MTTISRLTGHQSFGTGIHYCLGAPLVRLAAALQSLGVGSADRVGSLARNSDRQVETCMAVPWVRAVINPCNTRWSATEIAYSLAEWPSGRAMPPAKC